MFAQYAISLMLNHSKFEIQTELQAAERHVSLDTTCILYWSIFPIECSICQICITVVETFDFLNSSVNVFVTI